MCFGGSKSTNNSVSPPYAATPEAGATAVQKDAIKNPPKGAAGSLSDQVTQSEVTTNPGYTGLKL